MNGTVDPHLLQHTDPTAMIWQPPEGYYPAGDMSNCTYYLPQLDHPKPIQTTLQDEELSRIAEHLRTEILPEAEASLKTVLNDGIKQCGKEATQLQMAKIMKHLWEHGPRQ